MTKNVEAAVGAYQSGGIDRRTFLARLVGITGSMAFAHHLLETSGLADTVVSKMESQQFKVTSEMVTYPSGDNTGVGGYVSLPEASTNAAKLPAVVVIHENRGLNEHTRDVARRFAAEGFVALAPDLLSRAGGTGSMESPDKAREAITALAPEFALADLKAALDYLGQHPRVDAARLGSVGFCWGGARSFLLAVESDKLKAAVVFYGTAPTPEQIEKVHCPVLGLYGETDERITSKVPEVEAQMKKAGKSYTSMTYVGAGHAFFNDTGQNYNAAAAKDAWARSLAFLRANLKAA